MLKYFWLSLTLLLIQLTWAHQSSLQHPLHHTRRIPMLKRLLHDTSTLILHTDTQLKSVSFPFCSSFSVSLSIRPIIFNFCFVFVLFISVVRDADVNPFPFSRVVMVALRLSLDLFSIWCPEWLPVRQGLICQGHLCNLCPILPVCPLLLVSYPW